MNEEIKVNFCARHEIERKYTCTAWELMSMCKYFDRADGKWFDCRHRKCPATCISVEAWEDLKITEKIEDL